MDSKKVEDINRMIRDDRARKPNGEVIFPYIRPGNEEDISKVMNSDVIGKGEHESDLKK